MHPNWVVGFIDAEGCFLIILSSAFFFFTPGGVAAIQMQPPLHTYLGREKNQQFWGELGKIRKNLGS
jgi:hypothetical protein